MNQVERIGKMLRPTSIAVVGASTIPSKLAGQIIPSLIGGGFAGQIYPINPKYQEVAGVRCYPSLAAVPGQIDHCVIIVGQDRVPGVLTECARLGVAGASIFSSGFAEVSDSGRSAQDELRQLAGGMPFIGPNCMGFANLVDHILATTSPVLSRSPQAGDIALLSQSGGVAYATLCYFAVKMGMGFSYVINTGNTAGIAFGDMLEYMFEDPSTHVVLAVAESEAVVADLANTVERLGLRKPVVLLKLGRGDTGVRMAMSHTGSMAGDYKVVRDCAEQAGIVCVEDVDEALEVVNLLRSGFTPKHAEGLSAISISGGHVTLFADVADSEGLPFAELSHETEQKLRTVLPEYISVHNPIDITALGYENPELHREVIEVLVQDPGVHTVIPIITTMEDYSPVCRLLADLKARTGCAIIVLWSGGSYDTESEAILASASIPLFRYGSNLVRALVRLRRAAVDSPAGGPLAQSAEVPVPSGSGQLTEGEAYAFLAAGGVPVPRWEVCSRDGMTGAAERVGYPVVVKLNVTDTHISDRGGVILGVRDEQDLRRAATSLAGQPDDTVLVAQYLPGTELVVSAFRHPQFGPLLMIGSGGVLVELLKDVRFARLPASRSRLAELLASTASGRALRLGFRGRTGFEAAVDLLERVGSLALAAGKRITQIELNPVTVGVHGAVAVDAAVITKGEQQ